MQGRLIVPLMIHSFSPPVRLSRLAMFQTIRSGRYYGPVTLSTAAIQLSRTRPIDSLTRPKSVDNRRLLRLVIGLMDAAPAIPVFVPNRTATRS